MNHDLIRREELRKRFTNREPFLELFREKVAQPPPVPVLMFYGVGGIGKTYLLHFLKYEFCTGWGPTSEGYAHAFLSFRPGHTPTSSREALWLVRRQFSSDWREFAFPRFDLVWGRLWERNYGQPIRSNTTLLPDELNWLSELLQGLEQVPLIGDVAKAINLFGRVFERARRRVAVHRVHDWFVQHLEKPFSLRWREALDLIDLGDLEALLPIAIAADLAERSATLSAPYPRAIVFVDTYESLQAASGIVRGDEGGTFVSLFAEELLKLNANVLLVMAGKDRLRWGGVRRRDGTWVFDNASPWALGVRKDDVSGFIGAALEQHLVDDLSPVASTEALRRRGLEPEVAERLVTVTHGYPLGLATGADLINDMGEGTAVSAAALRVRIRQFPVLSAEWRKELAAWLLERLLEQLAATRRHGIMGLLRAASIPRWFDEELLYQLEDGGGAFQDNFDHLITYSFIESHELGVSLNRGSVYRLHSTVRACLREDNRISAQQAAWHRAALDYFQRAHRRSTDIQLQFRYSLEVFYHTITLTPQEGLRSLEAAFDFEIDRHDVANCEALLEVLNDLAELDQSVRSLLGFLSGRLALVTGNYDVAIERFLATEGAEPVASPLMPRLVAISQSLGESYRLSGEYGKAFARWTTLHEIGERDKNPYVRFLAAWGASLTHKMTDNLRKADELATDADALLGVVQTLNNGPTALSYGLHRVAAKAAHLSRHRAEIARCLGDYVAAASYCEQCLASYEVGVDRTAKSYALLVLAHILRMEGRFDDGITVAHEVSLTFEELRDHRGQRAATRALCQLAYAAGRDAVATRYAQQLIDSAPRMYPYGHLYGNLILGEIARAAADFDAAKGYYAAARLQAERLGNRIETAYVRLGLAELARQTASQDGALSLIDEACEVGVACSHPWLQVHANVTAACGGISECSQRLADAAQGARLFRRRAGDLDQEAKVLSEMQRLLTEGSPVSGLRFNFA